MKRLAAGKEDAARQPIDARALLAWAGRASATVAAEAVALAAVVALGGLLRARDLDRPFIGHHDFHQAFYSLAGAGRRLGEYNNWPPLTDGLYALSISLFGETEWAVRVLPVALSLGTVVLVYLIGRDMFGRGTGLLAAALFAILPGEVYFARLETFAFFIALTIWAYQRWLLTGHAAYLATAAAANIVGFGFSYAVVLIAGPANLFLAVLHRDVRGQALMIASATLAMGGWLAYLQLSGRLDAVSGQAGHDNVTLLLRSEERDLWLTNAQIYFERMFTLVAVAAPAVWLLSLIDSRVRGDVVLLLWGLATLGWLLSAPQHSRIHDMWWLPLAAPLALITARAALKLPSSTLAKTAAVVVVLAATGWLSRGAANEMFALFYFGPPPLEFGQEMQKYLDEDDTLIGWWPNEVYYTQRKGYVWPLIRSEAAYAELLAREDPAVIVVAHGDPAWRFEMTRAAGYVPFKLLDWIIYFRADKAELAAAGDPELAASLAAVRSLEAGSFLRGRGDEAVYYFDWGVKMLVPEATARTLGLGASDVALLAAETLAAVPETSALPELGENSLVKGSDGEVYVVRDGARQLVANELIYDVLGPRSSAVMLPDGLMARIPQGPPLQTIPEN